jgi:F420-non-reducing hydrogenase large subunit
MKRNVLGVIEAVGLETGKSVIRHRGYAVEIENIVGGKSTHPVFAIPGGVSRSMKDEEQQRIQELSGKLVEFCEFTLTVVDDVILSNKEYLDIILNQDLYYHNSYHLGMVDEQGKLAYYGGKLRVMDPEGSIFAEFEPDEYLDHVAEHPVPWSYLKFPFLKQVGWKGLEAGKDSGIYRVAPLSRMNVAEGFATPKAQAQYERFYETLGGKPVQNSLSFHWARAIEALYAAERLQELANDDDITSDDFRTLGGEITGEGVGVIEAPRGTLFHHYKTDEAGLITDLNLIVASAQNYAAMNIDVRNVAKGLIKKGQVSNGILNMVEMAFRSYDPCFSCATHAAIGQMPIEMVIRAADGTEVDRITR